MIGLAKDRQIEVIERTIMPEEMADFEECFLTGTAAEVTPVSEIGEYKFTPGQNYAKFDGRLRQSRKRAHSA